MSEEPLKAEFRRVGRSCAYALWGLGALVIIGWAFDISLLKQVHPGWNAMEPNVALGFLLGGIALALIASARPSDLRYGIARGLGAALFVLGVATLLEETLHLDFGIDQLLFLDPVQAPTSGLNHLRMARATAALLAAGGGVLISYDVPTRAARRFVEWASLAMGVASLVELIFYLYGVSASFPRSSMAPHTVVGFLLFSLGLRLSRPDRGITALLSRRDSGAHVARQLLPVALILVPLLGWLGLIGERAGLYETEVGTALFAVTCMGVLAVVILRQASLLANHDSGLREAEKALATAMGELEARVAERTRALSTVNEQLVTEVVERKRIEAALRSSEQGLSTTLHSIGDAVIATDLDGSVARMNPVAERLTGLSLSQAEGRPIDQVVTLVDPSTRAPVPSPPSQALLGQEVASHALLIGSAGEYPIAASAAPIRDASGQITGAVLILRDITKERRAEAILRRSEVELRAVIDQLPECVFIRRRDELIYANRAFLKTLGYMRQEELTGRPIYDLIRPEDQELVRQKMPDTFGGGHVVVRMLKRDGQTVTLEMASPQPIQFEGGPAVLLAARDVTDRQRAEAERTLLREVAIAASNAVSFEASVQRTLDLVCEHTGFPVGHAYFVERDVSGESFLHSAGIWHAGATFKAALHPGFAEFRELTETLRFPMGDGLPGRVAKSGKAVWIDDLSAESVTLLGRRAIPEVLKGACALPVQVQGKETVAVIEFFRADVSSSDGKLMQLLEQVATQLGRTAERQHAHAELRLSEERFRTLSSASPVGILEMNAKGDPVYANETLRRFLGFAADAEVRSAFFSAVHPQDQESLKREWLLCVHEFSHFAHDFRLVAEGQTEPRWVHTRATPIRAEDGRPTGWVATIEDIHARKVALEELERARQFAEAANRSKSEFLANMSHEIRTPMNAIIGMADLMWDTELTAEQRKFVETSRNAGEHLLTVVSDVLDLSKVESGQLELERIDFDLVELTEKTLDLMAVRAAEKGLELACHISSDVPEVVVGDPHRLRQVLVNLVSNAIKFTERGEVVLRVEADRPTAPSGIAELSRLKFSVSDTGIGIAGDQLERIFESFTQADASTTRKYGGTGLGLSISRKLVGLMGGRLWAESELGRGATFAFTADFPAGNSAAAAKSGGERAIFDESSDSARRRILRGLKVLLVDDAPDNRLLIEAYLKGTGCVLDMAEDGEEAVEKFHHGRYDLVLMDMQMPIVDGYTATQRMRSFEERNGRKPTPIVALTANALKEDVRRSLQAGATAHLSKPIRKATLLEEIGRVCAQEKPDEIKVDPDLREIVPGFLSNRKKDLEALERALESGDFATISGLGHVLKGLGGGYGFPRVTEIGDALERAAKAAQIASVRNQIDALRSYLEGVRVIYD